MHDLATGAASGRVTLPGLGSVGGLRGRPEGGPEAWLSYTDHATPPVVLHYDARTGETGDLGALARRRRGRARHPGRAGGVPVRRRDHRPHAGHLRAGFRGGRGRPAARAPARHPVRLRRLQREPEPRLLGHPAGLGAGGRRLRHRRAARAAARKARNGTGRACASTSRTCSTTSPPPPARSSTAAGPRRGSWPCRAGPTAACWSARPSPSSRSCSPPRCAPRRCWT